MQPHSGDSHPRPSHVGCHPVRSVRTFVINPRNDDEFAALVREAGATSASAQALQGVLRQNYPRAVVRPRQLEGERDEIWYVYREGAWIPSR